MVEVIFDTNIYGKIVEDKDEDALLLAESIKKDNNFNIRNFRVVRDELRKYPKLLPLYDSLVSKNQTPVSKQIEELAKSYFKEYKSLGGTQSKTKNFMNDLMIVACASAKGCNLVFSNDKKSMHNSHAIKAYRNVNLKSNLRTPTFYYYEDLKEKYSN